MNRVTYIVEAPNGIVASKHFNTKEEAIEYAQGLAALSASWKHFSIYELVDIHR